jgi:hypothetical protein
MGHGIPMRITGIEKDEEFFLLDRSYAFTLKVSLICLGLACAFLILQRVLILPPASAPKEVPRLAYVTDFLTWGFLMLSWAVLLASLLQLHARSKRAFPGDFCSYRDLSLSASESGKLSSRTTTIDTLYAELRPLMSRAACDPSLKEEVQAKLSRLRLLQSEEADEMQKRFEAGLLLKPGEGWKALERAREILARYENTSSPDPTPQRQS